MASKEGLEQRLASVRLERQRESGGYAAATGGIAHDAVIDGLRREIAELDEVIGPLAKESGELRNPTWGRSCARDRTRACSRARSNATRMCIRAECRTSCR